MAAKQYVVRKYDGDDVYSYAVFRANDVKGLGSQIFYGDARPVYCGLGRDMANFYKDQLNNNAKS